MDNNKTSAFILVPAPRTGWREPSRASDDLLKRPKGEPLEPTEVLREKVPTLAALGAETIMATTIDDEVSAHAVRQKFAVKDTKSYSYDPLSDAPSKTSSKVATGNLDGTFKQSEAYNGDAEDGRGVAEQMFGASSVVSVENATSMPESGAKVDDDELLAGVKCDSDDDNQKPPIASSPHNSQSPGPRTHQAKILREGTESIRPHPTDATKVIISYRYTEPNGNIYTQETEMPEVVSAPANASNTRGSIIVPDVEKSKVPRTKKGSPWTPVPGTSRHEWTRGVGDQQETWRIVIFFRRLDQDTHRYQDIYINTNMLNKVDPNDKRFRTSYNKWILQFARRRDATYTQKVARIHWSIPERRALYTAINIFCAKYGIHHFGFSEGSKLTTKQLQLMADAVNAVPNPLRVVPRGVDAVRGQIVSAHDKAQPKNKAIFDLLKRAVALRARIVGGEAIPRAERKPQLAIPLSEFPVDPPVTAAGHSAPGGRKRKRTATVEESDEEPSSSELSSPSASEVGMDDGVSEHTWMTTDEEIQPGESEEGNWSDTSEELFSGEEGEWVEIEVSSPPAKKARTT